MQPNLRNSHELKGGGEHDGWFRLVCGWLNEYKVGADSPPNMKNLLLLAAFMATFCLTVRPEDPAAADVFFKRLVAAQTTKDYDAFVADGTDQLKAALTKT